MINKYHSEECTVEKTMANIEQFKFNSTNKSTKKNLSKVQVQDSAKDCDDGRVHHS